MNNTTFIRGENAPDGIHERIEWNEYRNPRWWTARMHRAWILDRIAPWAVAALLFAGFAAVGIVEGI